MDAGSTPSSNVVPATLDNCPDELLVSIACNVLDPHCLARLCCTSLNWGRIVEQALGIRADAAGWTLPPDIPVQDCLRLGVLHASWTQYLLLLFRLRPVPLPMIVLLFEDTPTDSLSCFLQSVTHLALEPGEQLEQGPPDREHPLLPARFAAYDELPQDSLIRGAMGLERMVRRMDVPLSTAQILAAVTSAGMEAAHPPVLLCVGSGPLHYSTIGSFGQRHAVTTVQVQEGEVAHPGVNQGNHGILSLDQLVRKVWGRLRFKLNHRAVANM